MEGNEQITALQQELQKTKVISWDMQQRAAERIDEMTQGYQQLTQVLVEIGQMCGVSPTEKGLDLDAVKRRIKHALDNQVQVAE